MKEAMMESTPLFSPLTEEQRTLIADRMVLESRRAGDVIYQQGRPATTMYLIRSGWARLVTDQFAVLANLSAGSLLGEADTVSGRNYSTSAEAATDLSLWSLSAAELKAIMAESPQIARALRSALGVSEDQAMERHLRRLELMAGLSPDQLQQVAGHLRPEHLGAGQVVFKEGTPGTALYLIDEGQVQVRTAGGATMTGGRGDIFGEDSFLTGDPHSTTVTALTDVIAWSLARPDFEELALRYPALALNLTRMITRGLRERDLRATAAVQVVSATTAAPVPQAQPYQAPTQAVTGSLTGLNRASDSATSWWGARSTGAKVRLIAVIVLLIWLLGVAAPSVILSLLGRGGSQSQAPGPTSFQQRAVLVAMAADLPVDVTPTYTPWPTETPIPTATFTPTATSTNTPIPTATFTPTNTPVPSTNTPIPTATPRPVVRQVARQAPAAPAVAAAAMAKAAPAPAAAPSVQFKLVEMRRLSPCENRGNHHIFVKVVDGAGNPVDGVVLVQSPSGQPGNVVDKAVSGSKGPGQAEFIMWKGAEYGVYVSGDGANPGSTDIAQPLHSGFTDEAECGDGGGGNTLFHNSFSVIFRRDF